MPYTLPLTQLGKDDLPTAGGKGANLGELARLELPIPPGFVITTAAYDDFIAANDLQAQIIDLAAQVQADDPASFEAASEKIRALFKRAVLPNKLAGPIQDAYKQAGNGAIAVRSSATAEDLPSASFAGQQDTYLNIKGNGPLLMAVKNCWASLWTARAIAYRQRQGIAPAGVSLAVVVQTLIPAEAAGILFTANPITGARDEIMISAAWGLGEAVVGGLVTPDSITVNKTTEQITSRETAAKTVMTVRKKSGTEEQPVPEDRQKQPAIDDSTALQLAQYGAQIEAHYGMPMDIEWAVAEGEIAILQARPITALPAAPARSSTPAKPAAQTRPKTPVAPAQASIPAKPAAQTQPKAAPAAPAQSSPPARSSTPVQAPTPARPVVPAKPVASLESESSLKEAKPSLENVFSLENVAWDPVAPNTIWMRRQIVEHMPEPLSPLFEDLYLRKGLGEAMTTLMAAFGEVGNTTFDYDSFVPTGFAATINGYAYTTSSARLNQENMMAVLRVYAHFSKMFQVDAFKWNEVVLPKYQALITHWRAVNRAGAADEDLLHGMSELAAADSAYWFGSAVNLGMARIMDSVFDALLKSPLVRVALPTPRPVSATFLRGFASKALDAQADMEALANTIRESESLRDLVLNTAAAQLLAVLAKHPEGQPVLASIQRYLDEYGHQIYNLDFVVPTQNEDPLPVLLSLKALVENPPAQDVRTRQAKMAEEREALIAQTMAALNPLALPVFRWVWKWTKRYAPYREHVIFYMGAAWPTVRKLARELGRRLAEAGVIASPDDLYYLTGDEITAAIEARADGQPLPDFTQLAQERRDLREARKLLTPPPIVPERGEIKIGPIKLDMFNPTPADVVNKGAVLNGYAVSTGRVTAPASVIYSVEDFDQMQPGTILVAATTTPAWTPLFSQAAGLVTDIGGALAHGSIVAREYGIPAVMGTGVATERIKPGMRLIVDGDTGTVTLVDEAQTAAQMLADRPAAAQSDSGRLKKVLLVLAVGVIAGLIFWRKKRGSR